MFCLYNAESQKQQLVLGILKQMEYFMYLDEAISIPGIGLLKKGLTAGFRYSWMWHQHTTAELEGSD